jgi:hypothetical protein
MRTYYYEEIYFENVSENLTHSGVAPMIHLKAILSGSHLIVGAD